MSSNNEYMKTYMLDRYHERRRYAVRFLGSVCVKCGSKDKLELDHIDRDTKTMDLGRLWSVSWKKYVKELKLCQLLCETCHLSKTAKENSVNHGEGLTGKRNCRCNKCAPLKNKYNREFKRARSQVG